VTDHTGPPVVDDIHRLLDETFAGVQITPDVQDLKEEIRANLLVRVAELEAAGQSRADASRHAIAQLGDVRELFDGLAAAPTSSPVGWSAAARRHRVRPKAAFVVGVVVAALATTIGLLLATLGATGVLPVPTGVVIALTGIAANGAAWIVGDSLAHETTTNHPMPATRASGYFLASFLAGYGLGFGGLIALGALPVWTVVFAALGAVAAIVLFAFLRATQTNRQKAWVREFRGEQPARLNRFHEEPETAARFGIYTMAIWVVGLAAFVVLGFTTGWAWSWLALLGGLVIMMITLARMVFRPR
jgi:MFS family permease